MKRKYYYHTLVYTQSNFIESNCGDITFRNTGFNSVVIINNGIQLNGGQFITLPCNEGELDITKYNFTFVPGFFTHFNRVAITQKKYI